jgi:hypothetical protein
MSNRLAALVQVLGAGYAGYLKGQKAEEDRAQEKADHQEDRNYLRSQREYETEQRDQARALDKDVSGAMADQNVQDVTPTNVPLPMEVPTYKLGDQTFGDKGAADVAALGVNSRASKYQRAADAAGKHGMLGAEKAAAFEKLAKDAIGEGTDQALSAIQASAPALDAIKKAGGSLQGTVGQQASDVFNRTGGRWKVAADTPVQYYVDKDAAGREFVNSRVLRPDGTPLVDDVHHAGLALQDYKTRLEAARADTTAYQDSQKITQTGKQIDETGRHNVATEAETKRDNAARNSIAQQGVTLRGREVGVMESKDRRDAELLKNQTPEGQLALLEKANGKPFSDQERKTFLLGLSGLGKNKVNDEALVSTLTTEFAKNNPQATAQQVAQFRDGLSQSFAQAGANRQVEGAVHAEFIKNPFGSAGYAQTYNDAKTQLHMTDQQLAALGYKAPPQAPAKAPVAAAGTAPPSNATTVGGQIDVRADPTLQSLNAGLAKLAGKTDPESVKQIMALGTAKNERIEQLRANYGSMAQLVTQ